MFEDVLQNRQSTLEIYETIPMTNVSPLSPIADSYPLPQDAHIVENLFDSVSALNVENVNYYDTVQDSQNSDTASSDGAVEGTNAHPATHVLYESLLGTRTDANAPYNSLESC
ncbi:uncharacterized protein LOC127862070 [Dreissena polymorpha]|nr:uncharacterized protein LOC127862070 [Dreissena polymorpha]